MIPATEPRAQRDTARMLVVQPATGNLTDALISDLPDLLQPGDAVVVNDAGTLPASLFATSPSGTSVEIRLLRHVSGSDWKAVLLGTGDWRTPTERRDPPVRLVNGSIVNIGVDFDAEIIEVSAESHRLVTVRFSRSGVGMWTGIYAYGRPIQYSYLKSDLALWSVQTAYASRPWSMEMPSAGQPLTWRILLELKRRGVRVAWLTHAACVSSIGDEYLDSKLPFPERYEIPQSAIEAIDTARREGKRVIAVGTTVVRALEGCAAQNGGQLIAGSGETDLVIQPPFRPSVVNGILTGVHDPAESHFRLLHAFADETLLQRVWHHAVAEGYRGHEFGDICLVLAESCCCNARRSGAETSETKTNRWLRSLRSLTTG
jgi:S-adenosylmethionine:tRNA ribosyltransferase-isomerase